MDEEGIDDDVDDGEDYNHAKDGESGHQHWTDRDEVRKKGQWLIVRWRIEIINKSTCSSSLTGRYSVGVGVTHRSVVATAIAKAIVLGGPGIGKSANSSAAGEHREHENSQHGPNHLEDAHNLKMRHDYDHQLF